MMARMEVPKTELLRRLIDEYDQLAQIIDQFTVEQALQPGLLGLDSVRLHTHLDRFTIPMRLIFNRTLLVPLEQKIEPTPERCPGQQRARQSCIVLDAHREPAVAAESQQGSLLFGR
jgi:hypothetical protein